MVFSKLTQFVRHNPGDTCYFYGRPKKYGKDVPIEKILTLVVLRVTNRGVSFSLPIN